MDTNNLSNNLSRVEITNHRVPLEKGGGRVYVYWDTKDKSDISLSLQDEGRTLKIFINDKD